MSASPSIPVQDILETFAAFKRLGKAELLKLHHSEIGTAASPDAYRHELIGVLMRHRFGDGAKAVVRQYR